jgi:hypothetical protein
VPYSPSPWLERLAERLLPPACAEHVLGDLAESSTSRPTYLRNLISVLPHVVWSQIRRRVTVIGILFHATITSVFLAAFLKSAYASGGRTVLLRAAVPWAIWVIGRTLAGAYGPRDKRAQPNRTLVVATALTALVAAAAISLPVVRVALALGAVYATLLLMSGPWIRQPPPLSHDTLADHARLFQTRIWWRNIVESIAGLVILVANSRDLWYASSNVSRAAHGLLIAGVLFVIAFLHLRAHARPVPTDGAFMTMLRFHQRELARQRDILRLVPWWYLFPFVPGLLVLGAFHWQKSGLTGALGLLVLFVVFFLVWRLNVKAATLLDGQLHKVNALEGQL